MDKKSNDEMGMGPQYSKDSSFTARMRFHQSWYRSRVLKVPFGTGPKPGNTTSYGNMLARREGERGLNFLNHHLFEIAKRRLFQKKGAIEPFRLFNNMLSSQPMCFNLFGPLVDDAELAARLMQAILPGGIHHVSNVALEYAPEPAKDYLNDRTAFDAFVEYVDPAGRPGFVGIETKLTEAFSAKSYGSPFYNRWMDDPAAPWPASAHAQLQAIQVNQLWRDHLLAVAMKQSPHSSYASGRFMLVYHPLDAECNDALAVYQTLLKPDDDSFIAMPLDRLVEIWKGEVNSPDQRQWLTDFSLRYLELEASEAEFILSRGHFPQ